MGPKAKTAGNEYSPLEMHLMAIELSQGNQNHCKEMIAIYLQHGHSAQSIADILEKKALQSLNPLSMRIALDLTEYLKSIRPNEQIKTNICYK